MICDIEMGNVFTQTYAIFKQKKIKTPDRRKMKVLMKRFLIF